MISHVLTLVTLNALVLTVAGLIRSVLYHKQSSVTVDETLAQSCVVAASLIECMEVCTSDASCAGAIFCTPGNTCGLLDTSMVLPVSVPSDKCKVYNVANMPFKDSQCTDTVPRGGGEPRLLIRQWYNTTLYDGAGSMVWNNYMPDTIRAMAYFKSKCRIYLGSNPVSSVMVNGSDQIYHGTNYSSEFTIMGMSVDEARNVIYLSVSNDNIERMDADGNWTGMTNAGEVSKPRQNQLDHLDNKLYWADEALKTVKSVSTGATSPVTTVFTSTRTVWGMDIDIQDRKIYWCAKSTGQVWVYDMVTLTNTQLVPNGNKVTGSCSGLRLYNGFLYLIYYRLDHVEKRFKNGKLASKLLEGKIKASTTKYFAIIE